MGKLKFDWEDILFVECMDMCMVDIKLGLIDDLVLYLLFVVNVGNFYCVFFVEDVNMYDFDKFGLFVENYLFFFECMNVSIVIIKSFNEIC